MIALALLLAPQSAHAVTREDALQNAAIFSTHVWTMGADNETASCSSSYESDYSAGDEVTGIPYDWGGFVTTSEYDAYIADGYGAGSHSWHGVLWCTVGVDCSGFVSQAWETSSKYGTSTFYQVTDEIDVSSLKRGDALNDAGSHIVMFAYQTASGLPVHFETGGTVVFVDSDQGWSAFSSYEAIRYEDIEDGAYTGTASEPIEIDAFPYEDLRYTAGAASDAIDSYDCSPDTDESGPEQIYHFEVAEGGTLAVRVSDDEFTDVDIHVVTSPDGTGCLDRDDTELEVWLEPGEYWLVADTYLGSREYPGPYQLRATFDGVLGEADTDDDDDEDTPDDDQGDDQGDDQDDDQGGDQADDDSHTGEGERHGRRIDAQDSKGCATATSSPRWALAGLGLIALGLRRRRT